LKLKKLSIKFVAKKKLPKQAVLAPRLYGGADEKNLTAVKFFESWGVKKPNFRIGFIRVHRISKEKNFLQIRFPDFEKMNKTQINF